MLTDSDPQEVKPELDREAKKLELKNRTLSKSLPGMLKFPFSTFR